MFIRTYIHSLAVYAFRLSNDKVTISQVRWPNDRIETFNYETIAKIVNLSIIVRLVAFISSQFIFSTVSLFYRAADIWRMFFFIFILLHAIRRCRIANFFVLLAILRYLVCNKFLCNIITCIQMSTYLFLSTNTATFRLLRYNFDKISLTKTKVRINRYSI